MALLPQGQWRKLSVNIASLFSVQVANYLLPLLTVPYVSRVIGPERSGLLNLSMTYNSYFVLLVSFGFDMAMVRLVATNRHDKAYINKLFNEIMVAKLLLLALAILVFSGIAASSPSFRSLITLHIATCSYCIGTALFPQWLFHGMEDLSRIAFFSFVAKLLMTLGVFVLVRRADDYIYQNAVMSLSQVFVSLVALWVAVKRYKLVISLPSWQALFQRFREGTVFFFSTINNTLYSSSHVFLLNSFSTPYAIGVFTAGTKLEGILRIFITMAFNQALFPIVANGFGKGQEYGLHMVRRIMPILLGCTVLAGVLLYAMAPFAVATLFGSRFASAVQVVRLLSVLPVLLGLNSLLGTHTMLNLHMDKPYFYITLGGSVFGILLGCFLVPRFGYMGASIGWVCTETAIVLAMFSWLANCRINIFRLEMRRVTIE